MWGVCGAGPLPHERSIARMNKTDILLHKRTPLWWMISMEVILYAAATWLFFQSEYATAALMLVIIELRELNWRISSP